MNRSISQALLRHRVIAIALAHVLLVTVSYAAAILLRFEFAFPARERATLLTALPVLLACRLALFARYHLFEGWWQYVGVRDVIDIAKSTAAGTLAFVFVVATTGAFPGFPRSLFVLEAFLTLQGLAGARVLSRLVHSLVSRLRIRSRENVLLVGSGPAADSALRELLENPSEKRPVGFLDDGSLPGRRRLRGVPRLGGTDDLPRVLAERDVAEVLVAVAPGRGEQVREVARRCRSAGIPFRVLPSTQEHLESPRADLDALEQLFGTDPEEDDGATGRTLFGGKTVLLLGAGGQIGSRLAWNVAESGPRHLVLLDRNESPLYYLEVEFLKRGGAVNLTPVIADLLDEDRLREVLVRHRPEVVIHAATYARSELFEDNRTEIAQNNLEGTENALRLAEEAGVERFLLLSADEARRDPLSCLHRAAEWRLRERPRRGRMIAAAVRFPETLGSPGCDVTRAARALQRQRPLAVASPDARVRIASIRSVTRLLVEAFAVAEDGDVLAVETGRTESLAEVLRYLRQVWNLPEIPLRRPATAADHVHPVEPGLATGHAGVLRRSLGDEPPRCVARWLGGGERTKGGFRVANSSGR